MLLHYLNRFGFFSLLVVCCYFNKHHRLLYQLSFRAAFWRGSVGLLGTSCPIILLYTVDSSVWEEKMSSPSHNLIPFLCCRSKFRCLLCNLTSERRILIFVFDIIVGDLLYLTLWYQAAVSKPKELHHSMETYCLLRYMWSVTL